MQKTSCTLGFISVFSSLLLAGCWSMPEQREPVAAQAVKIETQAGHEPAFQVSQQVNVGEVMYSEFEYQHGQAAQTSGAHFTQTVLFGEVKMPQGTLLESVDEADHPTYCSSEKVYYAWGKKTATDIACFADENADGGFERVQVPSVKFGTWTPTEGPTYSIQSINRKKNARQALFYQGRSGDTLKLAYREMDERGEPLASQTAEYTLSASGHTEIGFKKARLLIESADNSGIRYQVLQGFK